MSRTVMALAHFGVAGLFVLTLLVQVVIVPLIVVSVANQFPDYFVTAIFGAVWAVLAGLCVEAFLILLYLLLRTIPRQEIFTGRAVHILSIMVWICAGFVFLIIVEFIALSLAQAVPPVIAGVLAVAGYVGFLAILTVSVLRGLLASAAKMAAEISETI